jgi:mannose-6-phosphate isomerase-like protein (cupin superfamily)
MNILKAVAEIKENQATIDVLLALKKIKRTTDLTETHTEGKWDINSIYNRKDATIGFACCNSMEGVFPDHVHEGVIEYLVCVQGSFIETFGDNGVNGMRIVKEGDCLSIPKGVVHSSKPIVVPVKMVYVCVPQDDKIPLSEKDIP